jgi:hypothetical protein
MYTNIKINMDFPELDENVMISIYERVLKPILGTDLLFHFTFYKSCCGWPLANDKIIYVQSV